MALSLNNKVLYSATVTADVNAAIAATSQQEATKIHVQENAGAPAAAELIIKDAPTAAAGNVVAHIKLAASGNHQIDWPDGFDLSKGFSIDWVSGSVRVVVHGRQI